VLHETDSYGYKIRNGSWNGVVGLVSSGVAEIGVGHCTVTKQRYSVVEFIDTVEFTR